jgi:hypothetical protein
MLENLQFSATRSLVHILKFFACIRSSLSLYIYKVQSKTIPIKPVKRLTDVFNSKFGEIKPGGGAV